MLKHGSVLILDSSSYIDMMQHNLYPILSFLRLVSMRTCISMKNIYVWDDVVQSVVSRQCASVMGTL